MMTYVKARAPINIALIKYWGKKDIKEVLPYQPSLSLSLDIFETETVIQKADHNDFVFKINNIEDDKIKHKVETFIKLFDININLNGIEIHTKNTGPTAAGLASSASGFAALAVAVNRFFNFNYNLDMLSSLTRKGSGSAIRSLLPKAVAWLPDGHIEQVDFSFDDVCLGVVIINDQKKSIGSTEAMKLSVETSPLYTQWVKQSFIDFEAFKETLKNKDFKKLGNITEKNALLMHEVCHQTVPKIQYLSPSSYDVISLIQSLRTTLDIDCYVTMDAGPNVKVLTKIEYQGTIESHLNEKGYDILWSGIDKKGAVILDEIR
ncbi:MAG TPA: diphosphomevalonate decarboxylase [Acholeplasmataceae bacterium]|nr:diphosphomevalonate decarboxylase [Acholeplasmataceae bacterium]